MCFNVMSGEEEVEAGGQTVYIARGEDEELVTVTPEENTLSLVYRYVDTGKQGNRGIGATVISWSRYHWGGGIS